MQLFLTALERLAAGPDTLHHAASLRTFALTHGDYLHYTPEEPQRLGLSDGVPFFLDEDGHYDRDINRFLRNLPVLGAKSTKTWLAYACDIGLWARFLREVCGKHLWEANQSDINAYYRVRRITDGDLKVEATTWNRGVAALDKLYQWAYHEKLVEALPFTYKTATRIQVPGYESPIPVQRNLARERGASEGDLRYVSLEQYLVFRDVGLRGLTGVNGAADPSFKGRQGERNGAYADLLIMTGLRREEGGSFLAREVPDLHRLVLLPGQKSVPYQMPAGRCKGRKSRKVFLPLRVIRSLQAYTEFERLSAVGKGRKRGHYATVKKPLLVRPNGPNAYTMIETGGRLQFTRIGADAVGRILERDDEDALSPGQLFLGEAGLPLGIDSWNRVFRDASKRCQRLGYAIQVSPHTLRHTFAVNMLTMLIRSAIGSLHAEDLKPPSRRSYLRLIGDPLQRLQRMLGHSSITSTYIYLDTLDAAQEIVHEAVERWSAELDAARYIGEVA